MEDKIISALDVGLVLQEEMARQHSGFVNAGRRAQAHRCRIDAVSGGSPIRYDVTIMSGIDDLLTAWTVASALGTDGGTAQFDVGDTAILFLAMPEPASLLAVGSRLTSSVAMWTDIPCGLDASFIGDGATSGDQGWSIFFGVGQSAKTPQQRFITLAVGVTEQFPTRRFYSQIHERSGAIIDKIRGVSRISNLQDVDKFELRLRDVDMSGAAGTSTAGVGSLVATVDLTPATVNQETMNTLASALSPALTLEEGHSYFLETVVSGVEVSPGSGTAAYVFSVGYHTTKRTL